MSAVTELPPSGPAAGEPDELPVDPGQALFPWHSTDAVSGTGQAAGRGVLKPRPASRRHP